MQPSVPGGASARHGLSRHGLSRSQSEGLERHARRNTSDVLRKTAQERQDDSAWATLGVEIRAWPGGDESVDVWLQTGNQSATVSGVGGDGHVDHKPGVSTMSGL